MSASYFKCDECGEFYKIYASGATKCVIHVQPDGFAETTKNYCPKCSIKKFSKDPSLSKAFESIKKINLIGV